MSEQSNTEESICNYKWQKQSCTTTKDLGRTNRDIRCDARFERNFLFESRWENNFLSRLDFWISGDTLKIVLFFCICIIILVVHLLCLSVMFVLLYRFFICWVLYKPSIGSKTLEEAQWGGLDQVMAKDWLKYLSSMLS